MIIAAGELTLNHQLFQSGRPVKLAMIRLSPKSVQVWTVSGNCLRFHPLQQIEAQWVAD